MAAGTGLRAALHTLATAVADNQAGQRVTLLPVAGRADSGVFTEPRLHLIPHSAVNDRLMQTFIQFTGLYTRPGNFDLSVFYDFLAGTECGRDTADIVRVAQDAGNSPCRPFITFRCRNVQGVEPLLNLAVAEAREIQVENHADHFCLRLSFYTPAAT